MNVCQIIIEPYKESADKALSYIISHNRSICQREKYSQLDASVRNIFDDVVLYSFSYIDLLIKVLH